MKTFPYLKWDFGYQRYLPQEIIIDNFTCTAENYGAKLYLYPNYDDACFVKPDDFVQKHDYENINVLLPDGATRPMTEDDVFYGPLIMTQSVTYRNMSKAIPICPDQNLLLHKTLTAKLKIENN